MRYFAVAVFALHVLAETVFGLRGYLSGSFSWQAGVDVGALAPQIAGSARFLASGLLTLAALGAVTLWMGVGTLMGRAVAGLLAIFHLIGAAGIALTAQSYPQMWDTANTIGALSIHGVLGLGFVGVFVLHGAIVTKA